MNIIYQLKCIRKTLLLIKTKYINIYLHDFRFDQAHLLENKHNLLNKLRAHTPTIKKEHRMLSV